MDPLATGLTPEFLRRLARPEIETILLVGCGGGFDFVHGLLIYPTLVGLGKRVVVGSYSFGDPEKIGGEAPVMFRQDTAIAKLVSAQSIPPPSYCPEVHVCAFLDERFPDAAPHRAYAYYARAFSAPMLRSFYGQLVAEHAIDAVVLMDGGSDSLMRGDEEGLGDPIEDCVSITAVSMLEDVRERLLLVTGLGCDRYNNVSDAAALRAVAELTAAGGFLGGLMFHEGAESFDFYRDGVDFIARRQKSRSAVAGSVISAAEGHFGYAVPPRLQPLNVFLWPLMAGLWGFDIGKVAERSLMSGWIRDQETVEDTYAAVLQGLRALPEVRPVENLPRHEESRFGGALHREHGRD